MLRKVWGWWYPTWPLWLAGAVVIAYVELSIREWWPNNLGYALLAFVGVFVAWHLPQVIDWCRIALYGE